METRHYYGQWWRLRCRRPFRNIRYDGVRSRPALFGEVFSGGSKGQDPNVGDESDGGLSSAIQKLDWMDDKTKEQALQKLDTYTIKVGYPDHARDYSKLVVRKDDLIGNVRRAARADWDFL